MGIPIFLVSVLHIDSSQKLLHQSTDVVSKFFLIRAVFSLTGGR